MTNLEEIDYSLSYEEYLKNFRKTYSKYPQMQPMSKDQYELNKAKAEKQNSMAIGATKEELDYMLQNGQISRDAYDKQIAALNTPKVQEAMDAGTKKADETVWDSSNRDVDDAMAIGATKEELDYMLQNGKISKAAYDKQIAALNTPEVQEAMDAGTKKADETVWDSSNREVADSVAEVTTPKKDDPPEVGNSKNNYNKSMMSIWDAYRDGEIDKETAGYFTIDAIATLAKNLGRSIGNVGAQFSGGTIDNGHDESKWGQRQNALLNETIGKDTESLGGAAGRQAENESLDIVAKRIINAYTPAQLEQQIEMFKKDLENADIDLDMAHSRTDLINFIKSAPDYANSTFKMGLVALLAQAGVAGAANNASKTLDNVINLMLASNNRR